MRYLLDACALITLFNGETGDDIVDELLQKAETGGIILYMSIIQILEVYYDRIYVMGIDAAANILASILAGPIEVIDTISLPVMYDAGRLKTSYSLSLADAIGLATAKELSAQFVTSDHAEIEPIEHHERISILWLPAKPKKK